MESYQEKKRTTPSRAPNSKEVAALAKVSQATVSRVFSGQDNIREETRQKVLEAAKLLGYRPNALARSLTSSRSNLIAVVSLDILNPHHNALINKVTTRIQESGSQTLFFISPVEQQLDQILSQILQYQVDAIIVLSAALSAQMTQECQRVRVPVVVFNKYTINKGLFSVCSDNIEAGWLVANYLYDKGYRHFGFIGTDTIYGTSSDRQKGFTDCLLEKGIHQCLVEKGPYTYEGGHQAMASMLSGPHRPDAVFCMGDLMALGAMDCIRNDFGLRVPEDVAVVGFDNIDPAGWQSYNLTTVEQKIDAMMDVAFEYLEKKLAGEHVKEGIKLFSCKIIERSST